MSTAMDLANLFVHFGSTSRDRPDGSRRSDAELAAEFGPYALRWAKLDDHCRRRLRSHFQLCFPPRVFLSYKWGSDHDNRWVYRLSQCLKAQGLEVIHDADRDESVDVDVESLVSRVVDCSHFVVVITEEYWNCAVAGTLRTWVETELQVALSLAERGALRIAAVLREMPVKWRQRNGALVPRTILLGTGSYSCDVPVVDFSASDDIASLVQQW